MRKLSFFMCCITIESEEQNNKEEYIVRLLSILSMLWGLRFRLITLTYSCERVYQYMHALINLFVCLSNR